MQFCAKFVSFAVGFGDSLAQGSKELWHSQNLCLSGSDFWCFSGLKCRRIMAFPKFVSFWVGFLVFLWPEVVKNYGVTKICVFLHPDMLEFYSVGELSCQGCELEIECQIAYPSVTGKVQNLWKSKLILGNFGVCHPHIVRILIFACWGQGRKHTFT